METQVGAKLDKTLASRLQSHLDEVEAQTGYRPNVSDVVRDGLRLKLESTESSGSEPEDVGATA